MTNLRREILGRLNCCRNDGGLEQLVLLKTTNVTLFFSFLVGALTQ